MFASRSPLCKSNESLPEYNWMLKIAILFMVCPFPTADDESRPDYNMVFRHRPNLIGSPDKQTLSNYNTLIQLSHLQSIYFDQAAEYSLLVIAH